jgi:hypothetical protein
MSFDGCCVEIGTILKVSFEPACGISERVAKQALRN